MIIDQEIFMQEIEALRAYFKTRNEELTTIDINLLCDVIITENTSYATFKATREQMKGKK